MSSCGIMLQCRLVEAGGLSVSFIAPELWTSPFEFHLAALGTILWVGWRSQSRRSRDSELRRVRIRTRWFGWASLFFFGVLALISFTE